MKLAEGSRIAVTWKIIQPNNEILELWPSGFNDPDRFWENFRSVVPDEIILTYHQDNKFVWGFRDDEWPLTRISHILDNNMKYMVFFVRDMRTYMGWHGYMEAIDIRGL